MSKHPFIETRKVIVARAFQVTQALMNGQRIETLKVGLLEILIHYCISVPTERVPSTFIYLFRLKVPPSLKYIATKKLQNLFISTVLVLPKNDEIPELITYQTKGMSESKIFQILQSTLNVFVHI